MGEHVAAPVNASLAKSRDDETLPPISAYAFLGALPAPKEIPCVIVVDGEKLNGHVWRQGDRYVRPGLGPLGYDMEFPVALDEFVPPTALRRP